MGGGWASAWGQGCWFCTGSESLSCPLPPRPQLPNHEGDPHVPDTFQATYGFLPLNSHNHLPNSLHVMDKEVAPVEIKEPGRGVVAAPTWPRYPPSLPPCCLQHLLPTPNQLHTATSASPAPGSWSCGWGCPCLTQEETEAQRAPLFINAMRLKRWTWTCIRDSDLEPLLLLHPVHENTLS